MFRSRFFWKLYAGYVVLVVLAVATVGVLVARRVSQDSLREVEASLYARAALLREIAALSLEEPTVLQQRVQSLGASAETRLTVIAAGGVVIADSDEDPAVMDNHGTRPEVLDARDRGSGMSTRFSRTVAAPMTYFALPIHIGGELVGYVRAALPLTVVDERVAAVRRVVLTGGLLATAVALLLGLVVARGVTAPLVSMTEAAESIAGGRYSSRVVSTSSDEVGTLAGAFNRMAAELENRLATISEDRAKLLTILSGMVEGVIAVDKERRIVHLNASAARILDVSPSRSLGAPLWEVTRVLKVNDVIDETLRDAKEVTGELHLQQGSADRILELHSAPLHDGDGKLTGAVLVLHEVTTLRRLETVRQDFVANVSHELKTPITAIRGLIETVVDDSDMPSDTRTRFLERVRDQSVRLSSLVTDLLTLARLESAEGMFKLERIDLRELVLRSVNNLRPSAEEHRIAIDAEVPETTAWVTGDAEALELVLNNLLDNALKYTQPGGSVWMRLRADRETALLEVEDTGIGIASEHCDRIFERFYRVDKARSRELGGTGLGLSIVKHICMAHEASISVESEPGVGSTFRVTIPLAAASAAGARLTQP